MKDSIIHHFTRGGQVFFHQWHMTLQIIIRCLSLFMLLTFVLFVVWGYTSYQPKYGQTLLAKAKADTLLLFDRSTRKVDVPWLYNKTLSIAAERVSPYLEKHGYLPAVRAWAWTELLHAIFSTLGAALLVVVYFYHKGKFQMRVKHLQGDSLLDVKALAKKIIKKGAASDCVIDGLPLIKDSEVQHIGVVGTTGVGKSILIKKLMAYAASKSQRAIVYDKMGDLTAQFYNPERGDIILNPFDKRAPSWDLWSDCTVAPDFDSLAASLIPNTGNDPFWSTGARTIFAAMAREYGRKNKNPTLDGFLKTLLTESLSTHPLLKGTEAWHLVQSKDSNTTASFLSIIVAFTKSLRFVPTGGDPFSINRWVENGKGWLFLPSKQSLHASIKPLYASWITLAINSLMSLAPDNDRRLWFFLDELPTLANIPALPVALAEGRKFGACMVAGFQSIAQLDDVYGQTGGKKIAALLNTRFYFRQGDQAMAEWASRNLGEAMQLESHESISYGANTIRDGVNVNRQEKRRAMATTSELLNLPNKSCYVRLPGNYPVTKHELIYDTYKNVQSAYEAREMDFTNESSSSPLMPDAVSEKVLPVQTSNHDSLPDATSSNSTEDTALSTEKNNAANDDSAVDISAWGGGI